MTIVENSKNNISLFRLASLLVAIKYVNKDYDKKLSPIFMRKIPCAAPKPALKVRQNMHNPATGGPHYADRMRLYSVSIVVT